MTRKFNTNHLLFAIILCVTVLTIVGCGAETAVIDARQGSSASTNSLKQDDCEVDDGTFDYKSVKMEDVDSTSIAEVGYSPNWETLLVKFVSSEALYAYYDVSENVYEEFINADSLGSYFQSEIKDNYEYEMLESPWSSLPYHETSKANASFAINIGTGKIHELSCHHASGTGILYVSDDINDLIDMGLSPCGTCEPDKQNAKEDVEPSQASTIPDHYVINKKSKKFHLPTCGGVNSIKPENYGESTLSRDELISQGYDPCGNCKP